MFPGSPDGLLQPLVRAVEAADSSSALLSATQALAAALSEHTHDSLEMEAVAMDCLVRVMGFNNPGAAVAAVDALASLGSKAVEPLLGGLDEHNYGARAWAVRALSAIGDVRGLAMLEQALASDIGPSVRRAAAMGLGRLRLEQLDAPTRERTLERCLVALEKAQADGEWVVRFAVAVALEGLATKPELADTLLQRVALALHQLTSEMTEEIPVVRLRARLAIHRLQL